MAFRQRIDIVIAVRLENIGLQLDVVGDTSQPNAAIGKRVHLVLHVVSKFPLMRAFEPRSKLLEHVVQRQLFRRPRVAMRERDVARAQGFRGKRNSNQLRCDRI
jgi:hypothetical protein